MGTADSADKLTIARFIGINTETTGDNAGKVQSGNNISFDGTANIDLNANLMSSGVNAAAYGSATQIPIITVNDQGIVTVAQNVTPQLPESNLTLSGRNTALL